MKRSKPTEQVHEPARPPVRESAAERNWTHDGPSERQDYRAGADGELDVDAAPAAAEAHAPDGQLGPDEISEPDEVIKNNEAKLHH